MATHSGPKLLPTTQTRHVPLPTTAPPPPPTTTLGPRPQTPQLQIRPPTAVLTTPLRQGKISLQHPRLRTFIQLPHPRPLHQHQNSPVMRPMHRRHSVGNQIPRQHGVRMCHGMMRGRRVLRDGKMLGIMKT